jgi:HEAT repeat protein
MHACLLLLFMIAPYKDLKPLIEAIEDTSGELRTRMQACEELGKLGERAVPALPALLGVLGRRPTPLPLKSAAIDAIDKMGAAALPGLREGLRSRDADRRKGTATALAFLGKKNKAIHPLLVEGLGSSDAVVVEFCNQGLVRMVGPATVPALIDGLGQKESAVRAAVATALGDVALEQPYARVGSACAALAKALSDPDLTVRRAAAGAFSSVLLSTRSGVLPARDALPALRKALGDSDAEVRQAAAAALPELGFHAREAVADLVKKLKEESPRDRHAAAQALGRLGSTALAASPALRAALEDKDSRVRTTAATSLFLVTRNPQVILDVLEGPFRGPGDLDRLRVLTALPELGGDVTPALVKLLQGTDEPVRRTVMRFLIQSDRGERRAAVEALRTLLHYKSKEDILPAALALCRLMASARPAVPDLVRFLEDTDGDKRETAAFALGFLGPNARDAVPALLKKLSDSRPGVRRRAADALGMVGVKNEDVLTRLEALCEDDSGLVRLSASAALVRLGQPEKGMPLLLRTLKAGPPTLTKDWYELLMIVGPAADEAASFLVKALREPGLRDYEIEILARIGPAAVVELKKALAGSVSSQRLGALYALRKMGPAAAPAVPDLARLLGDADEESRYLAALALASIGPPGRAAVPGLIRLMKDPDVDLRRQACETLSCVAGPTPEVIEALQAGLAESEDESVQGTAAVALGVIGPGSKPALASLVKLARKDRGLVGLSAAYAVARIDPAHPAGVPLLCAALKDADWRIRGLALRYLAGVESDLKECRPALEELLGSEVLEIRIQTALLLGTVGFESKTAARLVELLKHPSLQLARSAAFALGHAHGPVLKDSLKLLLEALDDPDPELSVSVAKAVLRVDPKEAKARKRLRERVDYLVNEVEQSRRKAWNPANRKATRYWLAALEELGPDAREAKALLTRLAADDPDPAIQTEAARVLKVFEGKK